MLKLSIVTVCFNDLVGLKKTAASILENSDLVFEWVVVDGGSSDGSSDYIRTNTLISRYIIEADKGIYDAMNKGTNIALGEYVVYLNAGDVFNGREALKQLVDMIHSDVDIIFSGALFTIGNKALRYRAPRSIRSVWHSVPANHQATIFRRTLLGNNPYNIEYKICGDYELIARLSNCNVTCQVVDVPLVCFELGGVSTLRINRLSIEAFKIQRRVLKQSTAICCISWVRRQLSLVVNLITTKLIQFKGA